MFFSAAFLALPLFAHSVFAKDCTRKYTVQEGDICDSISAAHNVSTYQFSVANSDTIDSTCSNLVPGKEYCLGYAGEDCQTTYTVVPDDSCEQIAANHQINGTILRSNNPQINSECSNIYVGEVLCVANTVQVPPVPAGGNVPGATIPVTAAPAKPTPPPPAPPAGSAPNPAPPAPSPNPPNPAPGHDDDNDDDDETLPYCDEL
jgi:hypothetical protein